MEQAQSLKLNVTNIHKFLVGSNKQLAKLKKDKQNLLFKYEKQAQRRQKESKIEAKDFGIGGGLKRVASAVSRPAMSFFDRIKEFFGVILLGLLINNLPKIFAELKKFFNSSFIKGLRSFLSIVGKGFMSFVEIAFGLPQSKRDEFDKNKSNIENEMNSVGGTLDSIIKFFTGSSSGNDNNSSSDSSVGGRSSSSGTSGFSMSGSSSSGSSGSISLPVVPFNPSSPAGESSLSIPGYSKGGTVGSVPSKYNSGSEGIFGTFRDSVNFISNVSNEEENNIKRLASIADNLEYLDYTSPSFKSSSSSKSSPKISKASYTRRSFSGYTKTASGVSIDATGEPGVDFTPAGANNRAVFGGRVVEIGYQYNPNRVGGDGEMGSGYGNFVVVRSTDPTTGKEFDSLYSHFPSNGINVSVGQNVNPGDILGRMGTKADPRIEVGSLTGPHTSLDFYKPGSNQRYPGWRQLVNKVDPTFGGVSAVKKDKKNVGGGSRGGSGSVFVYAIQPQVEYVPMPYPVPVRQPSMSQNTQPPKPSALWRA